MITCELWERQGLAVMPTLLCIYLQVIYLVLCSVVLIACSVLCLSVFVQDSNMWLREGLCLSALFFTV